MSCARNLLKLCYINYINPLKTIKIFKSLKATKILNKLNCFDFFITLFDLHAEADLILIMPIPFQKVLTLMISLKTFAELLFLKKRTSLWFTFLKKNAASQFYHAWIWFRSKSILDTIFDKYINNFRGAEKEILVLFMT